MNHRTLILGVMLGILLGGMHARAATQRWSYDDAPMISSIMADGSGGCSYVRRETNDLPSAVVWLDKKGALIYRADLTTNLPITIINCTKKQLTYATWQDNWRFVQVARDGTVTPVTAGDKTLTVPLLVLELPVSFTTDRKGFFGLLVRVPSSRVTLVRYDNK
ncbi:MAG: hypothetical protein NTV22_19975 [bacterium]|nr:hypothetical protein [bacterium]